MLILINGFLVVFPLRVKSPIVVGRIYFGINGPELHHLFCDVISVDTDWALMYFVRLDAFKGNLAHNFMDLLLCLSFHFHVEMLKTKCIGNTG